MEDSPLNSIPQDIRPETVYGLSNTKGSCYVNSLFQSLFYTDKFLHAIISDDEVKIPEGMEEEFVENPNAMDQFSDEMKIAKRIMYGRRKTDDKESMKILLAAFKTLFILMTKSSPYTVSSLSTAPFSIILKSLPAFRGRNGDSGELFDFLAEAVDKKFETMPFRTFNIKLSKTISCSCGYSKSNDENEKRISLFRDPGLMSIISAPNNFERAIKIAFSESPLDGYRCPSCSGTNCVNYRKIKVPPENIMFTDQFYEFTDYGMRKIHERFDPVFELDRETLSTMFSKDVDTSGIRYRLSSAIIHLGHAENRGHFISLARIRKGYDVWGLFDDRHVELIGNSRWIKGAMSRYFKRNPFVYISIYSRDRI